LERLLKQLRAEREKLGLDLTDLMRLTGLKPSAVATLEADPSPDPTIEILARYAEVVGKRLTVR
jgi:transcriptional regulator with XRE-family HTH domain